MEFIRKHLEQSAEISAEDWNYFSSKLTVQTFPKRHCLLREGQTENFLSFIQFGIVRFYMPKEDKNDMTFSFSFENSFVSAYESFITRMPSAYFVETLTKTTLWRLTHHDLQEIYKHTNVGNTIGRLAAEVLFLNSSKRQLSLLNDLADQRYRNLFVEQPKLLQYIPLKYIASYIGISPQALSRIRKSIK
jgi:CRP-like cAMP-binding protein